MAGHELGPLRYSISHSQVQVQLKPAPGPAGTSRVPTLSIDLKDGKVQLSNAEPLPSSSSHALGLIGLLRLEGGSVLVLASKARKVCALPHPIYKITATQLITHENVKKTVNDLRIAHLLQEALDVKTYGQHLYFCYERDITRSVQSSYQRQAAAASGPKQCASLLRQADTRFLANGALLQPLSCGGADTFALPLIIGYVGQVVNPVFRQTSSSRSSGSTGKQQGEQQDAAQPQGGEASEQITQQKGDQGPREAADRAAQGGEDAGDEVDAEVDAEVDPGLGWSKYQRHCRRLGEGELSGHITLIARMAARRQGTLLWRKGLDLDGNAAHMIEVEQLVVVDMPGGMQQWLSHVQVRSSAPLLWSQPPDVWPTPRVRIVRDMQLQASAFTKFKAEQLSSYGSVTLLHLPGSNAKEAAMQLVLRSLAEGQAGQGGAGTGGSQQGGGSAGRGAGSDDEAPMAVPLEPAPTGSSNRATREAATGGSGGTGTGSMKLGKAAASGQSKGSGPHTCGGPTLGVESSAAGQEAVGLSFVLAGSGVRALASRRGLGLISGPAQQEALWQQVSSAVMAHGYFAAQATSSDAGAKGAEGAGVAGSGGGATAGSTCAGSATAGAAAAAAAAGSNTGPSSSSSSVMAGPGSGSSSGGGAVRWLADSPAMLQRGVLFTSDWDGMDEAPAAQHVVAMRTLEQQLRRAELLGEGDDLATAYPEVLQAMRTLWTHMANVTADQASGAGSMAGPILRTGHLSLLARAANLYFRGERWFHGAFLDARKQDALDLVSGAYQFKAGAAPAMAMRKNNYSALEVGAALTAWGLSQLYTALLHQHWSQGNSFSVAVGVALPLVVGLVLIGVGVALGVEQPQLCPQLIAPGWQGGSGL